MNYISTKLLVKKNKDSLIHGQLTDNKGAKNINGEREVSLRDDVGKISHMQDIDLVHIMPVSWNYLNFPQILRKQLLKS